jgi:hypothetical protein
MNFYECGDELFNRRDKECFSRDWCEQQIILSGINKGKGIPDRTWNAMLNNGLLQDNGNNTFSFIRGTAKQTPPPLMSVFSTATSQKSISIEPQKVCVEIPKKRNRTIPTTDWIGKRFANGWEIIRKISKEEEIEMGMGTHNAHFECYNHICGVTTCIEKTTLNTYLTEPRDVLFNCRKCNPETCKYKDKVRKQVGRDAVIADRSKTIKVGDKFGAFVVTKILSSTEFGGHQSRAIIRCSICGAERECLYHHLMNFNVACECFKSHSSGEILVKNYLDNHRYDYKTEYVFDELRGTGGGFLRYDFAIFKNGELKCLVEYDGEQHFQEAGTYFNERGQVQVHDNIKNQYALTHQIPLLRIPYTDAYKVDEILNNWLKIYI